MPMIECIHGPLDGDVRRIKPLDDTVILDVQDEEGHVTKHEYRKTGHMTPSGYHEYRYLRRAVQ